MVQLTEINNTKAILINSDNIADDMKYAIANNIKKIVISSRIGNYKLDNINFVEAYPEIQDLTISTYLNIDYSAIHSLKALKKLSIDVLAVDNQEIDFNNFQSLEDLNFNWRKKTINLEKCTNLKSLIISKYKKKDLEEFSNFSNLETLFVWQSSIESLEGIESLVNLKRLSLFKNKKLTSLKGLENLTSLVDLEIDECKSLHSIEEVNQLKNLKTIKIENCGAIINFTL